MRILYHSRKRLGKAEEESMGVTWTDWSQLLQGSDFLSLHVPLTPETYHLVGGGELEAMKSTAYLINTSRGPVVNEGALVWALQNGQIAGAGLDVYEREPSVSEGLKGLENVVLLPHVGSATRETRTQMAFTAAENLIHGLAGERPPDCLNWDEIL
jgi:glyoxylate reductase